MSNAEQTITIKVQSNAQFDALLLTMSELKKHEVDRIRWVKISAACNLILALVLTVYVVASVVIGR